MSAIASAEELYRGRPDAAFVGRVTQLNVLRSEWTKLWSLRSTRWSLLASFVMMAGLGPLVAAVQMSRWAQLAAHDRLASLIPGARLLLVDDMGHDRPQPLWPALCHAMLDHTA